MIGSHTTRLRMTSPLRRHFSLQYVAARTLVVDRHDRVLSESPTVHLVLHLRVATLHRVKVQRHLRGVLHAARRRTAA